MENAGETTTDMPVATALNSFSLSSGVMTRITAFGDTVMNRMIPLLVAFRSEVMTRIPHVCNRVMNHMIPLLVAFVALKYQSNPKSLFEDNPAPFWCFLFGFYVYWRLVDTFNHVASAMGLLSALSLLSLLLPHRVSFVPFVIWIPLPVVLAWPMLCGAYTWLRPQLTALFNNICARSIPVLTRLPV